MLSESVGKEIGEKYLLGRGYVYIENGSVVNNCNPKIADICCNVQSEDDERVMFYNAKEIQSHIRIANADGQV